MARSIVRKSSFGSFPSRDHEQVAADSLSGTSPRARDPRSQTPAEMGAELGLEQPK
jgi:hypothetical protein